MATDADLHTERLRYALTPDELERVQRWLLLRDARICKPSGTRRRADRPAVPQKRRP